jgi:O-antigen/teichoic acid export membrane protein
MQVLSAILRIKEVNLLEVSAIGAQLILLVLCVGFLKGGVGGALLAVLLSETIAAVSFLTMVIRYGGRPATPNFRLLKASVRFGMKTQLANLMKLLNVRLDAFFIASLTANGIHAAGVYSVATGFAELLLFVPQSLRLSLFPMVAASKIAEANRLTSASCRQALLLTAIGALGFGTIGPFLIPRLYGAAFAGSVTPLLILLPGIVMESQVRILYGDLSGRGKPGVTMVSAAVALLVTVLLDLILIPTYGIIGAAIASSCAYAVEFIVAALFFVHYSSLKWRDILLLRSSDLYYYQKLFLKHL